MVYKEFLKRVQEQAGLSEPDQAEKVMTATLNTLQACLTSGGTDALPPEIRRLVGSKALGALAQAARTSETTENPQIVGQNRIESGGESTPESGQ
jgi:uncharacterized protein (DUF2267 family)